eukprot:5992606-Prymnesium_polylepis.1
MAHLSPCRVRLSPLQREEAAADEDDEVLYYEVAPAGGKAGKGKAAAAAASYAERQLGNVASYLAQQQGATGLELTEELN